MSRPSRILIAVDSYVPARISGALQMHDLAQALNDGGAYPTVLVPDPDLGSAFHIEHIDGVEVLRVRAGRSKDATLVLRTLAEASLPLAMLYGLSRSPLRTVRWEGVVWYSPTIFLGPLVQWIKRQHGCRSYLILRDLFPDWAVDVGVMGRGAAYHVLKAVERYQYGQADALGVQTLANQALVETTQPSCKGRVEVLNNWLADWTARPSSISVADSPLRGRFVFVYTGNMGPAQGMDCVIDLADRLRARPDIGFLLIGRGYDVERLKSIVVERQLDNVLMMDEVDAVEIPGLLDQCQVGLVILDPRHRTHNIPGKMITYMRSGLPVLARINPGNDLRALIEDEGIGKVVVGDDLDALEQLALGMVEETQGRTRMGTLGRELHARAFSAASAARQVLAGLER